MRISSTFICAYLLLFCYELCTAGKLVACESHCLSCLLLSNTGDLEKHAYSVNDSIADDQKRIPFPHMIYFGDGQTDVPCMKIVNMFGGNSIAVYNPKDEVGKSVALKLKRQGRVNFITPAIYTQDSRTFKVVCAIIDKIKAEYDLQRLSSKL